MIIFRSYFRNYSAPFHRKWSTKRPKNYQKILPNRKFHIFLQESRIRRIFLLFSKKISDFYNEFIKSSSEVPFCVFVDAIFNFLEDHFISLRDFLICISSKKTSKIAAFIVRRFKKNEWCEHKRAVRKKRAFCDASR